MNKTMYLVACLFLTLTATAQKVIRVIPDSPDMTKGLQAAIEEARSHNGKAVTIELQNANYNIFRESSSQQLYHISNTISEKDRKSSYVTTFSPVSPVGDYLFLPDVKYSLKIIHFSGCK